MAKRRSQKPRDHWRYEFYDGRKLVYIGTTNDPERRAPEHLREGKHFTNIRVIGLAVTEQSAREWEAVRKRTYQDHHGGKLLKYNRR